MNHTGNRRLAVVTGASSGIGRELARQAAGHGYDVVLVARREQRLHDLAIQLQRGGVAARPVAADLTERAGVERVLSGLASAPVDVLVNAAGVGGRGAFAVERDLAADLAMIRLNVTALVELTGLLLPAMIEQRSGGSAQRGLSPVTCPALARRSTTRRRRS